MSWSVWKGKKNVSMPRSPSFLRRTLTQALCTYFSHGDFSFSAIKFWPHEHLWQQTVSWLRQGILSQLRRNLYRLKDGGSVGQFKEKEKHMSTPTWSSSPEIKLAICVPHSDDYIYVCFLLTTKAERSSGATSPTTRNPHSHFFFCISINAWSYKGLLTVFHHLTVALLLFFVCMVPLLRCPFGRTCYGKTCTFSLCTMH